MSKSDATPSFLGEQAKKALMPTRDIQDRADEFLARLDNEMRVMRWASEYRAIMWEAVVRRASIKA